MTYLQAEKKRQTEWKLTTKYLSREAKKPGLFRSRLYPFCLPVDTAVENLFPPIRGQAVTQFRDHDIYWHSSALPDLPSNHLCSSQVLCVNLLFPFIFDKEGLKQLLSPVFPDMEAVLPIEHTEQYLSFEWVPPKNYLREELHTGALRRGIGNTSIDFALLYADAKKRKIMVLGEMKYAESYHHQKYGTTKAGRGKLDLYEPFYFAETSPFLSDTHDLFPELSQEPYYQLLRQQLLARQIELHHAPSLFAVNLLYLYTPRNRGLIQTQLPAVSSNKRDMFDTWTSLLKVPDRFHPMDMRDLLSVSEIRLHPTYMPWFEYMTERYRFLT